MTGPSPPPESELPLRHAYAEAWFDEAVRRLRPAFAEAGHPTPPVRVSAGFADAGFKPGRRNNVVSICYPRWMSADGVNQVFVAPACTDPQELLRLLTHELVHAVDDCRHGHGAPFRRIAEAVGLDARGPQGAARSRALRERWEEIEVALGRFPRAPLRLDGRPVPVAAPAGPGRRAIRSTDRLDAYRFDTDVPVRPASAPTPRSGSPSAFG